jgi:hypothetical protein
LAGWFDATARAALSATYHISGETGVNALKLLSDTGAKKKKKSSSNKTSKRKHDSNADDHLPSTTTTSTSTTTLSPKTHRTAAGRPQFLLVGPWTHGGHQHVRAFSDPLAKAHGQGHAGRGGVTLEPMDIGDLAAHFCKAVSE